MRIIALSLLLAACSGGTDKDTGGLVGDAAAGADVYATNCASCHGASGEGGTGPAMADEVAEYDDAELEAIIRDGTDGGMPPFTTEQIDEQGMADLLAHLRETYGS